MNDAGSQFAPAAANSAAALRRSPLAHLLHALNQPLTGLQCSLELAVASPQRPEHYVHTLRESLELVARMRLLVEAIRELTEPEGSDSRLDPPDPGTTCRLDLLLRQTADELRPVGQARNLSLDLTCEAPLAVHSDSGRIAELLFRFLDSALSLARPGGDLRISAVREWEKAVLLVSWTAGTPLRHSPFSRPELGLLIAQAGWERAGAEWRLSAGENRQNCAIRLPLAGSAPPPHPADREKQP